MEHAEKPRTCSGDRPTQGDQSKKYADDPEFQRDACRPGSDESDEDEE